MNWELTKAMAMHGHYRTCFSLRLRPHGFVEMAVQMPPSKAATESPILLGLGTGGARFGLRPVPCRLEMASDLLLTFPWAARFRSHDLSRAITSLAGWPCRPLFFDRLGRRLGNHVRYE